MNLKERCCMDNDKIKEVVTLFVEEAKKVYGVKLHDVILYGSCARGDLKAARLLFQNDNYRVANNRAYYAMFHFMRAVLVFDNFDSSKHSGVIAETGWGRR